MKPAVILSMVLTGLQFAVADDFKTIDGKEYKNAKVSRVEPDGIVIAFSGGIVKLPFTELPGDVQKKYGYDSGAAAAYSAEEHAKQAALAQQRKVEEQRRLEERQKYSSERPAPSPVAPQQSQQSGASSMRGSMLDERPSGPTLAIYGNVLQNLDDGLLISVRETNSVGTERIPDGAPVLIVGKFPAFYDGDKIQAVGKLAGPYEYTNPRGAKRTARALTDASVTKLLEFPSHVR
jgi:hypothetical protein